VPGIMVVGGALGVALGLAIACGVALAGDVLPDPHQSAARGLGIFNLGTNLGQAAAPLAAAAVVSHLGGYPALFVASAGLMLVAGGLVFAIRRAP
jgi:MFS family permease